MKACAIHHLGPRSVAWCETSIDPPRAGEVRVETEYSAISAGTESLIFNGRMPAGLDLDAAIPALRRGFGYPVAYGYVVVGRIIATGAEVDAAWLGRRVFVFHPHQDRLCVSLDQCLPVPDDVSEQAALFLANTESALNFVMDARPVIGERLLVLGQGVVGLLTTAMLASFPLGELVAADPLPARRAWAERLGATAVETLAGRVADDRPSGAGFDAVIELSGNMAALNEAIASVGFGGRIIVGSWYGNKSTTLNLGGVFHRRRVQLISSQVSTLAPDLGGRWSKGRRLELAWDWIRRLRPECWITHVFSPENCQAAFELAARPASGALQVVFRY